MKKNILLLMLLMSSQSHAESIIWKPSDVRKMFREAEQQGQAENLKKVFSPDTYKILSWYQNESDSIDLNSQPQGIAPGMAAAAAAGIAVAIVDHYWDKFVGNGQKGQKQYSDLLFDISPKPYGGISLPAYKVTYHGTPGTGPGPKDYIGMTSDSLWSGSKSSDACNNRQALTPVAVVVAEATAGAVAYKAAQYALNKYGGLGNNASQDLLLPDYFDLEK